MGGDPEVAVTRERLLGYTLAMNAAGLRQRSAWIDYAYFAEEGGYKSVQRMLQLGEDAPTAYYAANDLMAIGILRALRQANIAVPDAVSVIGTNDSPEAQHVFPALTTLRVPYAEMAEVATEILIASIENNAPSAQRYVDCELLIRNSTGPCPA